MTIAELIAELKSHMWELGGLATVTVNGFDLGCVEVVDGHVNIVSSKTNDEYTDQLVS